MDQVSAIQSYIAKLKQSIAEEMKSKQEFQEKLKTEQEIRQQLEEKVEEMEKKLSKKTETIETLEITIDDLEKKVKCISDVREKKKSSFFGKMFNGNQLEQYALMTKQLENELAIQIQESENLHAQVFSLKTQMERQEQSFQDAEKQQLQKLNKAIQLLKNEKYKVQEHEKSITELNQQIDGLKIQLLMENEVKFSQKQEIIVLQQEFEKEIKIKNEMEQHLQKLKQDLINQQQSYKEQNEQIKVNEAMIDRLQIYLRALNVNSKSDESNLQCQLEQIQNIIQQPKNGIIQHKELYLDCKLNGYDVFMTAQDKILRLGKKNEQLIKQNKLLSDKLNLQQHKNETINER